MNPFKNDDLNCEKDWGILKLKQLCACCVFFQHRNRPCLRSFPSPPVLAFSASHSRSPASISLSLSHFSLPPCAVVSSFVWQQQAFGVSLWAWPSLAFVFAPLCGLVLIPVCCYRSTALISALLLSMAVCMASVPSVNSPEFSSGRRGIVLELFSAYFCSIYVPQLNQPTYVCV